MDIDVCRKCKCWRERLNIWNSVSGEKVGVELHCVKFRTLKWGGNLECANNDFLKRLCRENNKIVLDHNDDGYMKALGEANMELHDRFGFAIGRHRIPTDCDMKFEYTMEKWNK